MSDASFDAETTLLAIRARAGDREAFCALVELHHRAARRVAAAALSKHADADEAVQDACLTAWRRIDKLDDPAAFRAWLLRITWRKALDRRRSIVNWLGRLGIWPVLGALFFAMVGLEALGEILLYIGLALVFAATAKYVRDGLASRPSSTG